MIKGMPAKNGSTPERVLPFFAGSENIRGPR